MLKAPSCTSHLKVRLFYKHFGGIINVRLPVDSFLTTRITVGLLNTGESKVTFGAPCSLSRSVLYLVRHEVSTCNPSTSEVEGVTSLRPTWLWILCSVFPVTEKMS